MPKTLNIAVIGVGTQAQAVHLPVLRRRWDRFSVSAVVDHSERRRRESSEVWGIGEEKRFETVADLVAAIRAKSVTVDAALLSTDGIHVEDLLLLMRRGVPVLVEPPLGFSAAEVARIADLERMTGRRLVMMAYPQQYDESVRRVAELMARKDVRMVDHEVLMPASAPLFGAAHVTTSAYDLPSEKRSQRRSALQEAVVAGSGGGATQRDRDLYVKGLLTGVAHQLAVTEAAYGPLTGLTAVRHWPKGVIPGSIELLGEIEGGGRVRLVWHYLPFAPEYSEHVRLLSARKRMHLELFAPSHGDRRSTLELREKKSGVVTETSTVAGLGSAEAMWEAFHEFVAKGTGPVSGAVEALAQVGLMREVLAAIVAADGRDIDAVQETADEEKSADEEKPADDEAIAGEPSEGGEATGDAERSQDAVQPAASEDPAEATEPGGSPEAGDAPEPAEPAEPDEAARPTAPAESAEPSAEAEPAEVTEPSAPADPPTSEVQDAWGTGAPDGEAPRPSA